MPDPEAGYPDKARCTPVPDLFFSRDLADLDDPVALKVLLHAMWRVCRRGRGEPAAVREDDLAADPTLRRGLFVLGVAEGRLGAVVRGACAELARRGLLIRARVAGDGIGGRGPEEWFMLNDTEGRALHARLEEGERLLPDLPPAVTPDTGEVGSARSEGRGAGIFELYESNFGMLTPLLADELRDAAATYPPEWVEDAFRAAVANNARKWSYVRAILERWARDGRDERDGRDGRGGRDGSSGRDGRDGGADGVDRRRGRTAARSDRKDPYGAWIKR